MEITIIVERSGMRKPKNLKSLFSHCSNEMIKVSEEYYEEHTRPLLFWHGITCIKEIQDDE